MRTSNLKRFSVTVLMLVIAFGTIFVPVPVYAAEIFYETISSNNCTGCFVKQNGTLWAWGGNFFEFGASIDENDREVIAPIKIDNNAMSVNCHGAMILYIKDDNTLWARGILSNIIKDWKNTSQANRTPTKIMDDVVFVESGRGSSENSYIAVIKSDGSLWMSGDNTYGQLGNGTKGGKVTTPVKIMDNVIFVACGENFTAAITSKGELFAWGDNSKGQLGIGTSGNVQTTPVKVDTNVKYVACGTKTIGYVKNDGSVWLCGIIDFPVDTANARISVRPSKFVESDVEKVYLCHTHGAIIKNDKSLWTWGWNGYAQLGNGTVQSSKTPVKVLDDVVAASVDFNKTIALKENGSLWSWGDALCVGNNAKGNAFINGGNYQTVPVQIASGVKPPTSVSGTTPTPPVDEPSSWAKPIMEKAVSAGLVPASLQKDWQKPISRQETAALVVSFLEAKTGKNINRILLENNVTIDILAFTDTKDYNVLAVNALDIVTGFPGGEFRPSGTLTRAQATVFVYNIARVLGYDTGDYNSTFSDTVNHWAAKFIGFAAEKGIVAGVGNNKFNPNGTLTKEQLIAILYSMFIMP